MSSAPELWKHGPIRRRSRASEVAFGQVREDIALETSLPGKRVLCIASGGDTALAMLHRGAEAVVAVDVNPAQVHLVNLKAAVLRTLPYEQSLHAFTVDARAAYGKVRAQLEPKAQAVFDESAAGLARGLQNCGTVDRKVLGLGRLYAQTMDRRLGRLLSVSTPEAQAQAFDRIKRSLRWRASTGLAFGALGQTIRLAKPFKEAIPKAFPREFREQIEHVLRNVPAWNNPYVWQPFLGRFPPDFLPQWLTREGAALVVERLDRLTVEYTDAVTALCKAPEPFDLVCLSNILDIVDVVDPGYRTELAEAFAKHVTDKGLIVWRSFFSSESGLVEAGGGALTRIETPDWTDRSFFCRHVEILGVDRK